jgi:AcrR family transcriptional regulator
MMLDYFGIRLDRRRSQAHSSKYMASNEKPGQHGRRPYRLKKRASQLEETRMRITEALVELHRTVGPAKTTVTEVAEKAGVGRMTVYNHFATDAEMIGACSAHWAALNPAPDPRDWAMVDDPRQRLVSSLHEMYRFYRSNEDMLGNVLRDESLVPALADVMAEAWWPRIDAMVQVLAQGRGLRGARRKTRAHAALRLALDFCTWKTLVGAGLTDFEAAEMAASFAERASEA